MIAKSPIFVLLIAASPIFSEEPASDAARNRVQVFETWGDEWFRAQDEDGRPPRFHHFQSRRCTACGGNDWEVICEIYLPRSRWVATYRTTLHIADSAALTLSKAIDSVIDGPLRTTVRVTFTDREVRSEIELNVNPQDDLRAAFAKANAWKLSCEVRPGHRRSALKLVENMAISGAGDLSIPVVLNRAVVALSIKYVEDAEISHDGANVKVRIYDARLGEGAIQRYWVSSEKGLLQFTGGAPEPIRRVTAEAAARELAVLKEEAEAHRVKVEEHPDPEIRVFMKKGDSEGSVIMSVNLEVVEGTEGLEAELARLKNLIVKDGKEPLVIVDATAEVHWKLVLGVMDSCKKLGIDKVELAAPTPKK